MGRLATVVLPVLTLVLGIAIGRWWSDRDHAADRGRPVDRGNGKAVSTADESPAAASPTKSDPPVAPSTHMPAAVHKGGTGPAEAREVTPLAPPKADPIPKATDPNAAQAPKGGGVAEATTKEGAATDGDPGKAAGDAQDEAAARMLAVLFTNPALRDNMVGQMVAQVEKGVPFTDNQREAAKRELSAAMQPLVEAFQKGPVPMKDLDPKFQEVKEDWKRRLTPLLTAEQGLAFQEWLDQNHSLSLKMGIDEKGDPVDPDKSDDK